MRDPSIVVQLPLWAESELPPQKALKCSHLHDFWSRPEGLPVFVTESPTTMRLLQLLGVLQWEQFPERDLQQVWRFPTIPFATLAAAELIRLNENLPSMGHLHRFLLEHAGLVWLLGFPLQSAPHHRLGFNALGSLPTARHLTQMLRDLPNAALQFLLTNTIHLILEALVAHAAPPVECVSLDTKHILAWVKENNPKTYVADRFDKTKQPAGDPNCKLGCKRRHNQVRTPRAIPSRLPAYRSVNTTGAMALALSSRECPTTASSFWPNSPSPLIKPTSPTSFL